MTLRLSPVIGAQRQTHGQSFSVRSVHLPSLGNPDSPILVMDDFRVRGQPFGLHPHSGFAAVTYVFEDSVASLRSRDSLGNDLVVGPGGMIWSHAGRGMQHEEMPADLRQELHGLQFFVNLSSTQKLSEPRVLQLLPDQVPEWRSDAGDRMRIVVGSHAGLSSPLVPAEPFNLFDVQLRHELRLDVPAKHHAVIYALEGMLAVRVPGSNRDVAATQAVGISGGQGELIVSALERARFVILSAMEIPRGENR